MITLYIYTNNKCITVEVSPDAGVVHVLEKDGTGQPLVISEPIEGQSRARIVSVEDNAKPPVFA